MLSNGYPLQVNLLINYFENKEQPQRMISIDDYMLHIYTYFKCISIKTCYLFIYEYFATSSMSCKATCTLGVPNQLFFVVEWNDE